MLQEVVVLLVFITALVYLGRMVYRNFTTDSGCPKGCGSCSTIDFKKIERDIRQQEKQ